MYSTPLGMDALALTSSSASAMPLGLSLTLNPGLTSSREETKCSGGRFLKLSTSPTSKSPMRGQQRKRPSMRRRHGFSVEAAPMEPTNPKATSSLGKLGSAAPVERMRRKMIPLHHLRQGDMADDNPLVYRQLFVIRSYEVGPDKSTSIREIFSLFQEMALNHVHLLGIAGDGFGATRAMDRLGLIWVVTKMQVDVDRYPAWPEAIEIESWIAAAGKNGMRRDWVMRSFQTDEVLARATSTWCMMNATTRRLSKIPDEARSELEPHFSAASISAFEENDCVATRISTVLDSISAEHRSSHLTSSLADLDMNQHVNNLKYINWVLESVPVEHMKTHKLASMVLEYRRECHSTDVVESLTSCKTTVGGQYCGGSVGASGVEAAVNDTDGRRGRSCQYTHLLRLQGAGQREILRGKTTWRSWSDCR